MPDAPVVAPDPTAPGKSTSEFSLTKLFALLGTAAALVLPVAAAALEFTGKLQGIFPGATWLGAVAAALGIVWKVSNVVETYIDGRNNLKQAQLAGSRASTMVVDQASAAAVLRGGA